MFVLALYQEEINRLNLTVIFRGLQLGDIGSTFNGLSGKNKEDFGRGSSYVTYKQVFDSMIIDMNKFEYVAISDGEKQSVIRDGDVIFTVSSETPEEVGMSSLFLCEFEKIFI